MPIRELHSQSPLTICSCGSSSKKKQPLRWYLSTDQENKQESPIPQKFPVPQTDVSPLFTSRQALVPTRLLALPTTCPHMKAELLANTLADSPQWLQADSAGMKYVGIKNQLHYTLASCPLVFDYQSDSLAGNKNAIHELPSWRVRIDNKPCDLYSNNDQMLSLQVCHCIPRSRDKHKG